MHKIFILLSLFLVSCDFSLSKQETMEHVIVTPCVSSSLEGSWPEKGWWEQYGSLALNGLIEKALQENPTIEAAKTRILVAKKEAAIARSNLYPLLYFDANDQLEYLSKNGLYRALNPNIALANQQIDLSLSFSYEFDFWGKYRNLFNAALGRKQTAIAESKQTELIVATSIAQTFFSLQTNYIRKKYYEKIVEIRSRYFDLEEKMLKSSLYSKLKPLLSQEAFWAAEQKVDQIEQEIALNLHLLNILAGRGPDEPLLIEESLQSLSPTLTVPSQISTELLSRRPDLMAQIWRMEALAKEVGSAKADFFPSINISALAGWQSGSWSKLLDWASKTISALPGLSLPLYTAGEIGANIDAKKALFQEAVYQYNELILKSFQQVSDLLSVAKAVYAEKQKQEKIVANAKTRYELTLLLKKAGVESIFSTYQLEEAELEKKLEDVELLYQQYAVSIGLIKALGGGYAFESP